MGWLAGDTPIVFIDGQTEIAIGPGNNVTIEEPNWDSRDRGIIISVTIVAGSFFGSMTGFLCKRYASCCSA